MRVIIYYLVLNLFYFFTGDEGDNLLPCSKLILFFTGDEGDNLLPCFKLILFFTGDEGDNLLPCSKLILFFTAVSDQVYQFLAHGWWFSLGTPASSTTKTGRHDIAEILLKVAINDQIKSYRYYSV